jgi:hypothetical protein
MGCLESSFSFNLRRYTLAVAPALVGQFNLKPALKAPGACNQRLKLKRD